MATPLHSVSRTEALLQSLWQRNLPVIRDRLAQLDRAASLAAAHQLTPALSRDAAQTAHKLAGSLGMYGYVEGTRIARVLEQLLDAPDAPTCSALQDLTRDLRSTLAL